MKIFLILSFILILLNLIIARGEFNYKNNNYSLLKNEDLFAIETVNKFKLKDYENNGGDNLRNISRIILVDAFLTVPQLLKKYKYPSETHIIQTADGYLLDLHRIPKQGGIPVLLLHGILDSSAGWIIMGPKKSLAYILYDLGYDVWMGNCRGNTYGKKHAFLNTNSYKFWDFSFHEFGTMDLPEMFDHITTITGKEKIHFIAHSQGTTSFFIMCEHREGYCNRTLSVNALSPVAYLNHMRSPLVKGLSLILNSLKLVAKIFGIKEVLPNTEIMKIAAQNICKKEAITQSLCMNLLFLATGYDSEQLNKTMLPVIMGHIPAGSSVKQLVHYGQLIRSGTFRMYDYGFIKNLYFYGSLKPPLYDLSKVTAPVAIHYSMNDWISVPKDINRLIKQLPNVIGTYVIPLKKFNHMDFLLAIDVKKLVYDKVTEILKSYNNE